VWTQVDEFRVSLHRIHPGPSWPWLTRATGLAPSTGDPRSRNRTAPRGTR
jgi:hypothetical protein